MLQGSNKGAAGAAPAATRGSEIWTNGGKFRAQNPWESSLCTEMKIRLYPTQPVISRNADTLAAQGNLRTS